MHCTKISAEFKFGGHSPMQFCVDSNHMSHWNLSDHSITFTRWRHITSLLAQSLQLTMTRALQCVAYSYDVWIISAGCLAAILSSRFHQVEIYAMKSKRTDQNVLSHLLQNAADSDKIRKCCSEYTCHKVM